jgi:hypothetical protein
VRHSKKVPTSITLTFNEALDPASGTNTALYRILGAVKKHGKSFFSKAMKIKSVSYSAGGQSVTINLSKAAKGAMEVLVQPGLTAANGESTSGVLTQIEP